MHRFLLYLFPALADVLVGAFGFVSTVRMAQSGASPVAVGAVITVWGACYMVGTFLIGRVVTVRNCRPMMIGACIGMALCAVAFIALPNLWALYPIMAAFGVAVAFFFPPYMVFMKSREGETHGGLARSVAIYTLAWSLGLGAGPFVAGIIWSLFGWQWSCGLDGVLAFAMLFGIEWFSRTTGPAPALPPRVAHVKAPPIASPSRDFAWLAWIAVGACLLALSAIKAVFPASAASMSISTGNQGITLALICAGQAVVALALVRGRTWMYQPLPLAMFGLVGLAGFALFGLARTPASFFLAALFSGFYGGSAFIYLAFHALVHPTRAGRYVGVNESVVGLTSIIGPAAGGFVAERFTLATPYFVVAAIVAAAVLFQVVVHLRMPATASAGIALRAQHSK